MLTDALTNLVLRYLDSRDLLAWLLTFMAFDVLTGIVASLRERRLNSSIAWVGIWKKVATVLGLMFIIVVMPFISAYTGGFNSHIDVGATMGFVMVEVLSILENLGRCGVKTDLLAQYFEKVNPPPGDKHP